jgi:hypothetical protein
MHEVFFELQRQLTPVLRAGDLAQCERAVSKHLAALPKSPFHAILNLGITNSPQEVAGYFDNFIRQQPAAKVKAVYTEMNGFDINTDLWFCSPFAYQKFGGHDDYDWLSNWQSGEFDDLPITGLEALQKVYAGKAFRDERYSDASDLTSLWVVIKFQDLIRRAAPHMKELRFPLLATAHDFDFIYEVPQKS